MPVVTVAVIDTGLDAAALRGARVARCVRATRDGTGAPVFAPARTDFRGHGTACAAIIARLAPEAEVCAVDVSEVFDTGDIGLLAAAIDWCRQRSIAVLNLSLGVADCGEPAELRAACDAAAEAGLILVAAEHNDGRVSYPAHFVSVIGVRGGKGHGGDAYDYCPGQPIECVARGDAQRVCWLGGRQVLLGGSSFAAPRITGIVAGLKAEHPGAGLQEIRQLLLEHATRVIEEAPPVGTPGQAGESLRRYPWIRRAALYPYTKEMHAFVRFRDLLPFGIAGVADPPGRGQVGQDAGEAIGAQRLDLPIRAQVADAAHGADSLVLGYLDRLGSLRGRDLHREYLELALDRGLHVFSFEPLPQAEYGDLHAAARARGLHFSWPAVTRESALQMLRWAPPFGAVDVPVLGVFGTSASQGKLTLQLALRRRFTQLGYRVGQLGTEPHAELFGMDWAFPMGHGSTVDVDLAHYPEVLDRGLREICRRRRPDLILVGSQSGTIPFDLNDHRTLSLPSLAFLLGTKPDACVLVVNAIDPEDYVADTIRALSALAKAQVIALALSDRAKEVEVRHGRTWTRSRRAEAGEVEGQRRRLERRFGLPAIGIASAEGIEGLGETIVRHFAAPGVRAGEREECRKSA